MALNKLVYELAGLELCQFEVKKKEKKTFCECADNSFSTTEKN